jgi:rare lipoprotein A
MRLTLTILLLSLSCALAGQSGLASWYGEEHRGKLMANGQRFDPERFTAASWDHPMGAKLRVSTPNGFSVVVEVTDRGPHKRLVRKEKRIIDLSVAAFKELAGPELGLVQIKIERIK